MKAAEYHKELAREVDPGSVRRDRSALVHLASHFAVALGLGIFAALHAASAWPLPLTLLLAAVAGHSIAVLAFAAHEVTHGGTPIRSRPLRLLAETAGWSFALFTTPSLQRRAHNEMHHHLANTHPDPDRRLTLDELRKIGFAARIATWLAPNSRHPVVSGIFGFSFSVFAYHTSLLVNTLFRTGEIYDMRLARRARVRLVAELMLNVGLHVSLFALAGFALPMAAYLAAVYFVGTSIAGAYIATNHLLCGQSDDEHDPLAHTVSLRVPAWLDFLHLHFSLHVEHHLYPSLPHGALPRVREALRARFPDRYHELTFPKALRTLLGTPLAMHGHDTVGHGDGTGARPILFAASGV